MRDYFQLLFAHDHWANGELFTALSRAADAPPQALRLCSHLMATHRFWELRLAGESVEGHSFWPELSLTDSAARNDEYARMWPRYLAGLPEPFDKQRVTYRGLDGKKSYTFLVSDVLTQIHTHGAHHRAQALALLRAAGLTPPNVDYIRFCMKTGRVTITE